MTLEELIEETMPAEMLANRHNKEVITNEPELSLFLKRQQYHIYYEKNENGKPKLMHIDERDLDIDDENERIILR